MQLNGDFFHIYISSSIFKRKEEDEADEEEKNHI
jgi:hypothetical protein